MPLLDLLNQSNYDFYFLCVDKFLNIDLPQLKNFYSISPEKLDITLEEKNSGRLLSHPAVQKFITENYAKTGHTPAIIPFKPSAKIDLICQHNNWTVVSNPATLNRFFEDKIKFTEICQKTNILQITNLIKPLTPENYYEAQTKFGPKLVIQTHFGWAGNSTHLSEKYEDLNIEENTIVKFSPLLDGYSLLNNCCLTKQGLLQSPPALQYTGIKPYTNNPFATVGRQWPSNAPVEIIDQIKVVTENFAKILEQYNYRGFFGLDFFVSENKVYLLECNPRLTASFALYTQLELKQNLDPLFFYHLSEFVDIEYPLVPRFESPIVGAEVTTKDTNGTTIKKEQKTLSL